MSYMKASELVTRARSVIAKGCHYKLGHGGFDPTRTYPWDEEHLCDCSGFSSWALGRNRKNSSPRYVNYNGGWFETTAMFKDATLWHDYFIEVPEAEARPGDLYLYGDRENAAGGKTQGHVGIITEVGAQGPSLVVHCSRGNDRKTGDAIQETGPGPWRLAEGIVARCAWIETG